jgi:tetratricopeptide (TPR) repeat protein
MKRLYLFLLMMLLISTSLLVQGRTVYEDEAEGAYRQGDFIRAIELYELILSDNNPTYTLYFNLGQAYAQIGDFGRALLNYHRALYFAPRDEEILNRITTIRATRPDLYVDETGILEQLAHITRFFATWELTFLAVLVWSLMWGFIMRVWLRPSPIKRRLLMIAIVFTLILTGLTFNRVYIDTYRPLAIITETQTDVLSGAGIDYFPMFSLYSGTEARIIEERGIWAKIRLFDGCEGWVRVNSITSVNQ